MAVVMPPPHPVPVPVSVALPNPNSKILPVRRSARLGFVLHASQINNPTPTHPSQPRKRTRAATEPNLELDASVPPQITEAVRSTPRQLRAKKKRKCDNLDLIASKATCIENLPDSDAAVAAAMTISTVTPIDDKQKEDAIVVDCRGQKQKELQSGKKAVFAKGSGSATQFPGTEVPRLTTLSTPTTPLPSVPKLSSKKRLTSTKARPKNKTSSRNKVVTASLPPSDNTNTISPTSVLPRVLPSPSLDKSVRQRRSARLLCRSTKPAVTVPSPTSIKNKTKIVKGPTPSCLFDSSVAANSPKLALFVRKEEQQTKKVASGTTIVVPLSTSNKHLPFENAAVSSSLFKEKSEGIKCTGGTNTPCSTVALLIPDRSALSSAANPSVHVPNPIDLPTLTTAALHVPSSCIDTSGTTVSVKGNVNNEDMGEAMDVDTVEPVEPEYMRFQQQQQGLTGMGMAGPGPTTMMMWRQQQQLQQVNRFQQQQPLPYLCQDYSGYTSTPPQEPGNFAMGMEQHQHQVVQEYAYCSSTDREHRPMQVTADGGGNGCGRRDMECESEGGSVAHNGAVQVQQNSVVVGRRRMPGLWQSACQFRVSEMIRRYTFPTIRDIVIQESEMYSVRHGRPKLWYTMAGTAVDTAGTVTKEKGVEERGRVGSGVKIRTLARKEKMKKMCGEGRMMDEREDWSDYESELSDSDDDCDVDGVSAAVEEDEKEMVKTKRRRQRKWLDEEDEEDTDEDDEEDDDEDAEGEIDPDAWHNPAFGVNPHQQQTGSRDDSGVVVQETGEKASGGTMLTFYAGPVVEHLLEADATTSEMTTAENKNENPQFCAPAGGDDPSRTPRPVLANIQIDSPVPFVAASPSSTSPGTPQFTQSCSEGDRLELQQQVYLSPTTANLPPPRPSSPFPVCLTPPPPPPPSMLGHGYNDYPMSSTDDVPSLAPMSVVYESTLPVPPPKLSTIRALPLRQIEIGAAKVVRKGTPVDRLRLSHWARAGIIPVELMVEEAESAASAVGGMAGGRMRSVPRGLRQKGEKGHVVGLATPPLSPMPMSSGEPGIVMNAGSSGMMEWDAFLHQWGKEGLQGTEDGSGAKAVSTTDSNSNQPHVDGNAATRGGDVENMKDNRIGDDVSPSSPEVDMNHEEKSVNGNIDEGGNQTLYTQQHREMDINTPPPNLSPSPPSNSSPFNPYWWFPSWATQAS